MPADAHESNEPDAGNDTYEALRVLDIHRTLGHVRWISSISLAVFGVGLFAIGWGASLAYTGATSLVRAFIPVESVPVAHSFVVTAYGILTALLAALLLQISRLTRQRAIESLNESRSMNKRQAWEAARRKIQYYMHENLAQVRWIFWLSLCAMFLGFLIIIRGAMLGGKDQQVTSIVVTLSGVLVEFIAATFLFVYKATMEQATTYVSILERINAVGMADLLIDSIDRDSALRDQTRANIASEVLALHGVVGNAKRMRKEQTEASS